MEWKFFLCNDTTAQVGLNAEVSQIRILHDKGNNFIDISILQVLNN
jgi:hypothetical protein